MTCRVARSYYNPTQPIDLVSCCKCGSTHLEVFFTLKTFGPHLCQSCAQSMVDCGVVKASGSEPAGCLVPS